MKKTIKLELIVSKDLILFFPALEKADEIFHVIDSERKHLSQFLGWVETTKSSQEIEENLKKRMVGAYKGDTLEFYLKFHDRIIGAVGFVEIDKKNRKGEIGYWISQKYTGNGFIIQSVKRLLEYGFKELNLNKILIKMDDRNTKSISIPKKLGFVQEAKLREDRIIETHFANILVFGLLKSEYIRSKN